jgi:sec-independent protein translocase protein TatA
MNTIIAGLIPTGGMEWVMILGAVIFFFGGTKIPELAKGLGQSIKELRNAAKDDPEEGGK